MTPGARDSVLLTDVQRIEAATPFIKDAIEDIQMSEEQQKLEQ